MSTILVFRGETQDEALSRDARWKAQRKEILGYQNGSFIVHGRTCVDSPDRSLPQFINSPQSLSLAETLFAQQLAVERNSLIAARAAREGRNQTEVSRLLVKYGYGGV
jgi:hypothetical protein